MRLRSRHLEAVVAHHSDRMAGMLDRYQLARRIHWMRTTGRGLWTKINRS